MYPTAYYIKGRPTGAYFPYQTRGIGQEIDRTRFVYMSAPAFAIAMAIAVGSGIAMGLMGALYMR